VAIAGHRLTLVDTLKLYPDTNRKCTWKSGSLRLPLRLSLRASAKQGELLEPRSRPENDPPFRACHGLPAVSES
jgi:hypothetical protein